MSKTRDIEEAFNAAKKLSESVRMCFVPDTLEFLRAGGRVSNAAALCGSLLRLHPKIEIQDGYLNATKKYRGNMEKIAPRVVREYVEEQKLSKDELWMIYSCGLSDSVKQLAEQEAYSLGVKKVNWIKTGGVITTHSGPGAFGVVGMV